MSHTVKSTDGYDVKVPHQGQVTYNSVAGSLGLASFLGLNAGNILGNGCGGGLFGNRNGCSCADTPVTRYEMAMQQEIASKDSRIALLEANTYQDQKSLELYRYIDGKLNEINSALAAQAVTNTSFNSAMQAMDYKFTQQVQPQLLQTSTIHSPVVSVVTEVVSSSKRRKKKSDSGEE